MPSDVSKKSTSVPLTESGAPSAIPWRMSPADTLTHLDHLLTAALTAASPSKAAWDARIDARLLTTTEERVAFGETPTSPLALSRVM